MSHKKLTIGILGIKPSQGLVLRTILRFSETQLQREWDFDECGNADVIIADPTHPDFAAYILRSKTEGRPMCVSLLWDDRKAASGTRTLNTPLRSMDVVSLLKSAEANGARIARPTGADDAAKTAAHDLAEQSGFDNALKLVLNLQQEVEKDTASEDDLLISCAGRPVFRVRAAEGLFCPVDGSVVSSTDGDELLARLGGLHQAAVIEKAQRRDQSVEGEHWLPLSSLYWHLGVRLLSSGFLPGLNANMSFKLKSWPDFGTNGSDPRFLKMAAFMARRSLNLAELRSLTQQSVQVITAFINACALCQLVLPTDDSGQRVVIDLHRVLAEKKQQQGIHGVFSAIRSVFKLRA